MNSLPSQITRVDLADGYPALQVESEHCSATLALHGAHLLHWQPSQTPQPVLYSSPTAIYREGKAIRGGVPLCWPWFNAHPTAPAEHPSHGVARNRFWEFESATIEDGCVLITLILPATPEIQRHVPFPFQLKAIFSLGEGCSVALETTNLSHQNIAVGGALHTYLALSHISEIHLTGLQNTSYLDTTSQPEGDLTQSENELRFSREEDRIYYGTANPVTLHDPKWHRAITVSKENSLSTVIWNPWLEKATALSDLPDDGYQGFACIEAGNARCDTRILEPGARHRLVTTLLVHSLIG